MLNALTIDVEEYYHGVEFEMAVPSHARHLLPSRVESSVARVLDLLARHRVQATFFVVGEIATAHAAMVRRMASDGHEIACHSDRHELVWRQTPDQFRADIRQAKARLETISGQPVLGYRAPNFSIRREQAWAYDILLEEGFHYDSSVYPIRHDRYGESEAPRFPYILRRHGSQTLYEFPLSTTRLLGVNLPIGGGGYFRLLPTAWFRRGIRRVNMRDGQPAIFYFHPWELDPYQPRPPMPWHHCFRHYVNLHHTEAKLHRLLRHVRFAPVSQVLQLHQPL
jgi:polysaccharide deacetylase family protein (PEP-CTERM system associated)